jgi:hypothetical protein
MKNYRWWTTGFALALAGVLMCAELGWAQCGGYGYGPRNQGCRAVQAGWQGRGGPGYANCANYTGNGYCPQGYGNYAQGARRARWGGRGYYRNNQTPATPATPTNQ